MQLLSLSNCFTVSCFHFCPSLPPIHATFASQRHPQPRLCPPAPGRLSPLQASATPGLSGSSLPSGKGGPPSGSWTTARPCLGEKGRPVGRPPPSHSPLGGDPPRPGLTGHATQLLVLKPSPPLCAKGKAWGPTCWRSTGSTSVRSARTAPAAPQHPCSRLFFYSC